MSEVIIHNNQLSGSPIISYGDTGIRSSKTKLLAVLAGGFALLVSGLFAWLWLGTSLPLPQDMVLSAIIPAGTKLPMQAPEIWKNSLAYNQPLPTLVGYAKADDGTLVPFAVNFPSLISTNLYATGQWQLVSDAPLKIDVKISPYRVYGWPWTALKQNYSWLAMYPINIFGTPGLDVSGLPAKIQGRLENHVWSTDLTVGDVTAGEQPEKSVTDMTNQVPLLTESQAILHNYFAAQGQNIRFPDKADLGWNTKNGVNQLKIDIIGSVTTDTLSGLAQAAGLYDQSDYLLPDSIMMQSQRPPLKVFSSSTKPIINNGMFIFPTSTPEVVFPYHIDSSFGQSPASANVALNATNVQDESSCPGRKIAFFNASSLKNICTWLDFCLMQPDVLQINDNGGKVTFCY